MGNCHTVGPNEALVVSGNVTDRERCVSARRVFSCLVEFDEVFIGKDPINRRKAMFSCLLVDLAITWAENSVLLVSNYSYGFQHLSRPTPKRKYKFVLSCNYEIAWVSSVT